MKRGRKVADRWSEELSKRGYSVGEGLTSGAGGLGDGGGLRFSLVDQKEQGRKTADTRGACNHADRSWLLRGGEGFFHVSFMALKIFLPFPLTSQMCTSANPPVPELRFVLKGHD